jgi:hypothetical protein
LRRPTFLRGRKDRLIAYASQAQFGAKGFRPSGDDINITASAMRFDAVIVFHRSFIGAASVATQEKVCCYQVIFLTEFQSSALA